jgi:hypothetical protein
MWISPLRLPKKSKRERSKVGTDSKGRSVLKPNISRVAVFVQPGQPLIWRLDVFCGNVPHVFGFEHPD